MNNSTAKNARYILCSEYLFILLPFIVIAIVKFSNNESVIAFLSIADWSFAASILWGQTIIKIVSGSLSGTVAWQRLSFLVSILIVVCLVPTLVTLALMLMAKVPSLFLISLQMFLFLTSTIAFFWIGAAGQTLLEKKE